MTFKAKSGSANGQGERTVPAGLTEPTDHQGKNGVGRERFADVQRARMLKAMAEAAGEAGVANVTVAHVVERARVSRRTFYEIFRDVEDCFLAAFDEGVARGARRAQEAYEEPGGWRERIRAALIALLEFFDEEPLTARLLVVEAPGGGDLALKRRHEVVGQLVAAVEEGRSESKAVGSPPPLAGESVVGGVFAILHRRMLEPAEGSLTELVNPLMAIVVLPYLGAAAARKEAERPVPDPRRLSPRVGGTNPLKGLGMRLTYRTICVLTAVATNPRSSNKRVADASGISDQGQISKLLARLEKLGLVQNAGPGLLRGEPNIWVLTDVGQQVYASIAHEA